MNIKIYIIKVLFSYNLFPKIDQYESISVNLSFSFVKKNHFVINLRNLLQRINYQAFRKPLYCKQKPKKTKPFSDFCKTFKHEEKMVKHVFFCRNVVHAN